MKYTIQIERAWKVVRTADVTVDANSYEEAVTKAEAISDDDIRWSSKWLLTDESAIGRPKEFERPPTKEKE
jgi:hypothetical protein